MMILYYIVENILIPKPIGLCYNYTIALWANKGFTYNTKTSYNLEVIGGLDNTHWACSEFIMKRIYIYIYIYINIYKLIY